MNSQAISRNRLQQFVTVIASLMVATQALAITTVTDDFCNARLDVTVASSTRSTTSSVERCQSRTLVNTTGFGLSTSSPSDSTVPDSSAMVSAGGELYEALVGGGRDSVVLLTPNRTLMMTRNLTGSTGLDWNLGLLVQSMSGSSTSWLNGTYTFLRTNREIRLAGAAQATAALAEVFDPVTMKVTFNGDATCSISSYSSWFGYGLTTGTGYSQPDQSNYGFHQAVYAGAGSGQQHKESNLTLSSCTYTLGSDGKLVITYSGTKGDATAFGPYSHAYFVSKDQQYIVSTVDATKDLYRGFEIGVRSRTVSGTQSERNNSVAGAYLFNAPLLELQGSTGTVGVTNVHEASPKAIQCLARGSLQLTTTAFGGDANWNDCTINTVINSCATRDEEGYAGSLTLEHGRTELMTDGPSCRYQVAANGAVSFFISMRTQDGDQEVSFDGAIAKNNHAIVLRGKYEGLDMTNPGASSPERTIKDDLLLGAMVAIKYAGTLAADADGDGLTNEEEFAIGAESDSDQDGIADIDEALIGNSPFNTFDPPVVAVSGGYIVGIDDRYDAGTTANGVVWTGGGSYEASYESPRLLDAVMSSTNDICGVGSDGVWCLWWAFDTQVVYSEYLQPLSIDGATEPVAHDETGFLRYEILPDAWTSAITDAFKIHGDGATHTCVVSKIHGVYCWASNSLTDTVTSTIPAGMKNVATVTDVTVGTSHACAINGGAASCWGDSTSGKTTVPGAVSAPLQLAAGSNHTCAINANRSVSCWGDNTYGQKGDVDVNGYVDGVSNALRISAGANHTCAVTGTYVTGGTSIVCWGRNNVGQTTVPAALTNYTTTPIDVTASGNQTCAIKASYNDSESAMQCWPTTLTPP